MRDKSKERLKHIIRYQITAHGGKITPKDDFEGFIFDLIQEGFVKLNIPKIICICGSTKFADLHAIKRWDLEKDGKAICLMINYFPMAYAEKIGLSGRNHFGEKLGLKEILDELHLRKIDLADEVYIINKDGYIGESTMKEIEYAKNLDKPVFYMEPINR